MPPTLPIHRDFIVAPAEADLTKVGAFAVSKRGDLLLMQMKDSRIMVFPPTGGKASIGRPGEGPGEFRLLGRMQLFGDSLWTYDAALQRISVFSPSYAHVRSFRFPKEYTDGSGRPGPESGGLWPTPLTMNQDGSLLVAVGFSSNSDMRGWATGVDRGASLILRVDSVGRIKSRVASLPKSACNQTIQVGSAMIGFAIPFCSTLVDSRYQGMPSLGIVEAPKVDRQTAALEYIVTLLDVDGKSVFERRIAFTPLLISKTVLDSARRANVALYAKNPAAQRIAAVQAYPRYYPPVKRVVVGRDGSVWIEESSPGSDHLWRILSRGGVTIGTVVLPKDVRLEAAQLGTLWGVLTDEDGLEGVVRYRVAGK